LPPERQADRGGGIPPRGIGLGIATVLRAEGADVVIADIDGAGAAQAASRLCDTGEHALAV
jgi:NAD(P)-dependent dehydrogenase (short-subunit alcohol dehydrogenase family)